MGKEKLSKPACNCTPPYQIVWLTKISLKAVTFFE